MILIYHRAGKKASKHARLPKVNAEKIAQWLSLNADEVSAIWKCVSFAISVEYFQPAAWQRGSHTSVFHDKLKSATHFLVSMYINHLTKSTVATHGMSASSRARDFWDASDFESPATLFPSINRSDRPSYADEWAEFPEQYPSSTEDDVYKALVKRLSPLKQKTIVVDLSEDDDRRSGGMSESDEDIASDEDREEEESDVFGEATDRDEEDDLATPSRGAQKYKQIENLRELDRVKKSGKRVGKELKITNEIVPALGAQYDFHSSMHWGVETKNSGVGGLTKEDYDSVKQAEMADAQEVEKIVSLLNEDADEKYLTPEAIMWAKTSPAGKIELTIRAVCGSLTNGNEALWFMEERQKRKELQLKVLADLREQALRKHMAMNLVVEKYESLVKTSVGLKKELSDIKNKTAQETLDKRRHIARMPSVGVNSLSSHAPCSANESTPVAGYNRRREFKPEELYQSLGIDLTQAKVVTEERVRGKRRAESPGDRGNNRARKRGGAATPVRDAVNGDRGGAHGDYVGEVASADSQRSLTTENGGDTERDGIPLVNVADK